MDYAGDAADPERLELAEREPGADVSESHFGSVDVVGARGEFTYIC